MRNPKWNIKMSETAKLTVESVGPSHWRVQSESDPSKKYDVYEEGAGEFACTCEWTKFAGRNCKHVRRVMSTMGFYAMPDMESAKKQNKRIYQFDEMAYVQR